MCSPSSPSMIEESSNSPLSTTAGTDRRNEKRAAAARSSPRKSPAVIVAPERDTPGISAAAWAMPTQKPSFVWIWSRSRSRVPTFSAAASTSPSTISVVPITYRSRAPVSIWSLKSTPKTPIGTVPSTMYQPSLASCSRRFARSLRDPSHARAIRMRSSRK